jgi:hypothetical protein
MKKDMEKLNKLKNEKTGSNSALSDRIGGKWDNFGTMMILCTT